MVTFNREEIATLILSRGITFCNVDLTINGKFLDGKYFEGTATVKISDLYGDINCDGAVSLQDLVILAKAYGSSMDDPSWNDNANFAAPWNTIGHTMNLFKKALRRLWLFSQVLLRRAYAKSLYACLSIF